MIAMHSCLRNWRFTGFLLHLLLVLPAYAQQNGSAGLSTPGGDTSVARESAPGSAAPAEVVARAPYPQTAEEEAAHVKPVNDKYPAGYGLRYGMIADDSADDTRAFEKAIAVAVRGVDLVLPTGTIDITRHNLSFAKNKAPFRLIGAGVDKTVIRRGADFPGAFLSFQQCDNVEISGLTIDGGHDEYGKNGSHGLRVDRCSDFYVDNIKVRNWTDAGIIAFDSSGAGVYHDNIHVSRVVLDGLGAANNGILFSFTRYSSISDCLVKDLGKSGTPAFALQFKTTNKWGTIRNCSVINARAGVAIGWDQVPFPSNTELDISGIVIKDTTYGLHLAHSAQLHIDNIQMDATPSADLRSYPYAITLEDVKASSLTNISIEDHDVTAGKARRKPPVRIRNSDGNSIHLSLYRDVPAAGALATFENNTAGSKGSSNNVLIIDNMFGNVPADEKDFFTFESKSESNVVRFGSPIAPQ